MSRATLLAAALAASACATAPRPSLLPAGGVQQVAPGLSVELPAGWMRADMPGELEATRDGFALQTLGVQVEGEDPARRFLVPEYIAERDATYMAWANREVRIVEIRPAALAGAPGYRLELEYRDVEGLRYRSIRVGAVIEQRFCTVTYFAPARHYFDRDLPAFERALQSFRLESDR